jgi:hypothetical protein
MRLLLVALLAFSAPAFGAPFVVTDPVDPLTTHCGVFLDTNAKVTVPVAVEGTAKICKFDLATIPNGSHVVKMTAIGNDPIWGALESPQSLPLAFVRPAAPAIPAGVRLAP